VLNLLEGLACINCEEEAAEELVDAFVSFQTRNFLLHSGLAIGLQKVAWDYLVIEVF
jgi:hypothetical protein